MYTLIIKDEDGTETELKNVLTFDTVTTTYVRSIAEGMKVELTDSQIEEIGKALNAYDDFPNFYDIQHEIENITNGGVISADLNMGVET